MELWWIHSLGLLVVAYFLGATPTGYWLGRLNGIDIRDHGSKSIGATNVLRTLGKGAALAVLLVDVAKGVAAILFARWLYHLPSVVAALPDAVTPATWEDWMVMLAGLMAIVGHSRSIWINFTGGKSAATGLGVLTAMAWPVGLGTAIVFGVVLGLFRIVSLSSMSAALAAIGFMILWHQPVAYLLLAVAGGLYVIWRHQANIQRLLAGTEPRLGQSASESQQS